VGDLGRERERAVRAGDRCGDETAVEPPLGLDEYTLPVGITVYDCQADSTTTSVMQRLASKAADVRKALMVDVHRGNQVINLAFDPDRYYPDENPRSVLITVNCIFRTLYGNPYQR
jgi:hypothetical protein